MYENEQFEYSKKIIHIAVLRWDLNIVFWIIFNVIISLQKNVSIFIFCEKKTLIYRENATQLLE